MVIIAIKVLIRHGHVADLPETYPGTHAVLPDVKREHKELGFRGIVCFEIGAPAVVKVEIAWMLVNHNPFPSIDKIPVRILMEILYR